jgi:hypothetical protein
MHTACWQSKEDRWGTDYCVGFSENARQEGENYVQFMRFHHPQLLRNTNIPSIEEYLHSTQSSAKVILWMDDGPFPKRQHFRNGCLLQFKRIKQRDSPGRAPGMRTNFQNTADSKNWDNRQHPRYYWRRMLSNSMSTNWFTQQAE